MPDDFWNLEVRELFWKIEAFEDAKYEELYWLRWQTAALLNIHLEKKHRIEPEQLLKLREDKTQPARSKESVEATLKKWDDPKRVMKTQVVTPENMGELLSDMKIY
jgi:hypothetical protein